MEQANIDLINSCYEALLDLKCIFPSWSEHQDNFHYHWKQILNSSIKYKESDNNVLKNYLSMLEPILNYKSGGIESKVAIELVKSLDNYRKKYDEEFEYYVLETLLNLDVPSIKPPQKTHRVPSVRKKATLLASPVVSEDTGSGHTYGTRRSRMLSGDDGQKPGKSVSGVYPLGEHLKKGLSSDYVWEFTGNELKDDFDE